MSPEELRAATRAAEEDAARRAAAARSLDERALKAVGITERHLRWTVGWDAIGKEFDPGAVADLAVDCYTLRRFAPVSTEAKSASRLQHAALEAGAGWPLVAPSEDGGFICILGSDIEWHEAEVPRIESASGNSWARGETETEAIAEAVAQWGERNA